jgi:hypothetical protein
VQESAARALEAAGLPVYEVTGAAQEMECLGLSLEARRAVVKPSRRWRLRLATEALLARRVVSGRAVEIILGHYTFCMLLLMPLLSVFSSTYLFVRKHYNTSVHLWKSVRRELEAASALLVMIESGFDRPWSGVVLCSDLCLSGYATHCTTISREVVQQIGATSERWRFRLIDQEAAPARVRAALQARNEGRVNEKLNVFLHDLECANLELDPAFEEVPTWVLTDSRWSRLGVFRWRGKEPIHVKEARGALWLVRRLAKQRKNHAHRHLILNDNLGICCAFEKGRPSDWKLLPILRRWGAICVACQLSIRVRWIASELNPSDQDSRRFEPKGAYLNREPCRLPQSSQARAESSDKVPVSTAGCTSSAASGEGFFIGGSPSSG